VAERICVAQIGAAHGTRGEVKLKSFTADPMAVMDYGALETEDASASFEIESLRPAKAHLIAKLRGVHDRTAAERLASVRLFVPRARLPAPDTDEFYHADLIGLTAVTADGRTLGSVVAIHDFGAGDILELRQEGRRDTVMLPFTATTVPAVDIAGGRIVIDPPEGTFKEE
jgi:16S rRNA processing protein RimM